MENTTRKSKIIIEYIELQKNNITNTWTYEREWWACECVLWVSLFQQWNIHRNIITMYMEIFIHMNDIFLPRTKYFIHLEFFLVDEIFCPCGWKIFPHGKWKKGKKRAQVLNISKCGTNERNQKVFTWETLWNCWCTQQ